MAELGSIDNGKPYSIARVADLPLAVDMFCYMGGGATEISGRTIPWSLAWPISLLQRNILTGRPPAPRSRRIPMSDKVHSPAPPRSAS